MREPYTEDLASHSGPESCAGPRKGAGEALTGVRTGRVLSCEICEPGVPTSSSRAEGKTEVGALASTPPTPRSRRPLRHVRKLHARETGEPVFSLRTWDALGRTMSTRQ
jgi:hypothetical protein